MVSVTSFADYADAIKIANDTLYGLASGAESANRTRERSSSASATCFANT